MVLVGVVTWGCGEGGSEGGVGWCGDMGCGERE